MSLEVQYSIPEQTKLSLKGVVKKRVFLITPEVMPLSLRGLGWVWGYD